MREQSWCFADPVAVAAACVGGAVLLTLVLSRFAAPVRPAAVLTALGIAAGACAGFWHMSAMEAQRCSVPLRAVSSYEFVVDGDPVPTERGWRFEALCVDRDVVACRTWVSLSGTGESSAAVPGMGEVVRLSGTWFTGELDEFNGSLLARGVPTRVSATACEAVGVQGGPVGAVRSWRRRLLEGFAPSSTPGRALAAGVVFGMRSALEQTRVDEDFADLGLSHLVAVSGSHLAVVCSLLGLVLGATRAKPMPRIAVQVAALGAYVAFTGFQGSAVRSWCMTVAAFGARGVGRRSHGVSGLSVAATVLLLLEPSYASNLGFLLSVTSVLGIVVFSGLAGEWVGAASRGHLPKGVRDAVSLTLVAQVATMPATVPAFGDVALLAPIANVVEGPLVAALMVVGLACIPVLAALGGGADGLVHLALIPVDLIGGLVCAVAETLARVPGCVVSVEAGAAALGATAVLAALILYAAWPAPTVRRVALAVLVPLAVAVACWTCWRYAAPARIVVLDVGQGDAILVQDGCFAVLVDTGPDDAVLSALAREHVVHLDAVVLTHTDLDHVGGLDDLAARLPVGEVIVARGVAAGLAGQDAGLGDAVRSAAGDAVEIAAGERLRVGGFDLLTLLPRGEVAGDENEDSIVLLASYADPDGRSMTALLTGDAESPQIEVLARSGGLGHVDVYKAGHHGSAQSLSAEVMQAATPAVVVASAGRHNPYGHPSPECRRIAEQAGAAFLCTAEAGDVDVRPDRDGVRVRTRSRM